MSTSTTTTSIKRILGIGTKAAGNYDAETIQKMMRSQLAEAKSAGFEIDSFVVDNETTGTALAEPLRAKIRACHEHEQRFDGVVIGFGIRGVPLNSDMFQEAVNICVKEISPIPEFIFPVKPDDVTRSLKRAFRKLD